MHDSAYQWFVDRAKNLPHVGLIVEVGGRDINGSIRDLFSTDRYISTDLHPGPGVDIVVDALTWNPPEAPDLVLCAEVLEHAPQAGLLVKRMHDWLTPGGILLLATVGDPWPPHSGYDGGPVRYGEYYRGVAALDLIEWLSPFESKLWSAKSNGDRFAVAIKATGIVDGLPSGAVINPTWYSASLPESHIQLRDDLPPLPGMETFLDPNKAFVPSLPFEGVISGTWNDTDASYSIRGTGTPWRGGNQHGKWVTFDAEITGPDGETLPVKRVRLAYG